MLFRLSGGSPRQLHATEVSSTIGCDFSIRITLTRARNLKQKALLVVRMLHFPHRLSIEFSRLLYTFLSSDDVIGQIDCQEVCLLQIATCSNLPFGAFRNDTAVVRSQFIEFVRGNAEINSLEEHV